MRNIKTMRLNILIAFVITGPVFASRLVIDNITSEPSIMNGTLSIMRTDGAKEYSDFFDFETQPLPGDALEIYSSPYSVKLAIDSRPKESITDIEVELAVHGFVADANNFLRLEVLNITGFEHRIITAQQTLPTEGVIHVIPKDGSEYTVILDDLVNQGAGVYAVWRIGVERILEGDLNEDGLVDLEDFSIVSIQWLQMSSEVEDGGNYLISDTDLSRLTDLTDLSPVVNTWLEAE